MPRPKKHERYKDKLVIRKDELLKDISDQLPNDATEAQLTLALAKVEHYMSAVTLSFYVETDRTLFTFPRDNGFYWCVHDVRENSRVRPWLATKIDRLASNIVKRIVTEHNEVAK